MIWGCEGPKAPKRCNGIRGGACNLLDVVIASDESSRILQVTVLPTHSVSDHDLVTWSWTSCVRLPRRVRTYRFRNLKSVDWTLFKEDVRHSELFTSPARTANAFADQMDNTVVSILDRYCPFQERSKFASNRRDGRCLSDAAVDAERMRRQLERKWKSTRKEVDYTAYRKTCRSSNKLIVSSRQEFYRKRIRSAGDNPRTTWAALRDEHYRDSF